MSEHINKSLHPKISFIIPAYNVEKYIGSCLKSFSLIRSQEIEVIVVNDGSTDNTGEIIDKYCQNDDRFIQIKKDNGGLSSARNYGLKRANGEWIAFWDGDDYITSPFIDDIIPYLSDEIDLIYLGLKQVKENKSLSTDDLSREFSRLHDLGHLHFSILGEKEFEIISNQYFNLDSKSLSYLPIKNTTLYQVCSKLIKREIIIKNDLRFDESVKWAEDVVFNIDLYRYVKKVAYSNSVFYNYVIHDGSIMQSYSPNKSKVIMNTVEVANDKLKEYPQSQISCKNFGYFIIKQFMYCLRNDICNPDNHIKYNQRRKTYYDLRNNPLIMKAFETTDVKEFRLDVRILAFLSKYRMFLVSDSLIKIRERMKNG